MGENNIVSQALVSVIIPVYNTEEYLEEAVQSIINQTLEEIEIIIINDGSTDNSLQIIEILAKKDKRISFYSQENKGLSATRNRGIELAKGAYIYFMDSDDLLDKNALLSCYQICSQKLLDFVFFDAEIIHNISKSLSFDYNKTSGLKERVSSGIDFLEEMLNKNIYRSSVCLNLINHNFILKNKLTFYPGILHEDELYSFNLYSAARRTSFLNQKFYKRRVRENSIMTNSFSWRNISGYFTVIDQILETPIKENKKLTDKLIRYIINPVIYNASTLSIKQRLKVFILCVRKKFIPYIHTKNLIVLLFPILIQVKALVKKRNE